jgi:hypothetical protein
MAIQNIPPFPLRSQGLTQAAYSSGVEASLVAIPQMIDDLNAVGSAYALSTNGTSTTSVAIGTGSKSFTTQTGLGYLVGMTLRLAFDSVNYMTGDVTSYNTGTGALVVNVTSVVGSGTRTSWVISMAAVGANNASSVSFTPTGNISATDVQAMGAELDAEKLSNADGAVTSAKLASIVTGATVGSAANIPVMTYNAKGQITGTSTAQKIAIGTVNSTTSITARDFTSIPSTAKIIHIGFIGFSTNGTSIPIIQLGDSGGIENTGYSGAVWQTNTSNVNHSTGFAIAVTNAAASVYHGHLTLVLIDPSTNTWSITGNLSLSNSSNTFNVSGTKSLSDTLDRIRITVTNGTDQIDAGSNNIVVL